jgi:hypothetical protein
LRTLMSLRIVTVEFCGFSIRSSRSVRSWVTANPFRMGKMLGMLLAERGPVQYFPERSHSWISSATEKTAVGSLV